MQQSVEEIKKFYNGFIELSKAQCFYQHKSSCDLVIHRIGISSLKYFACLQPNAKTKTLLIVPSLINKSDILDITPARSLCNFLKQEHNVFLIDWESPEKEHKNLDLDYYTKIIIEYMKFLVTNYQNKVTVIGHCFGGNLATAATIFCSDVIEKLVLISTPWDFSKMSYLSTLPPANYFGNIDLVPADFISMYFNGVNFDKIVQKYIEFYTNPPKNDELELFMLIEKWANYGINLSLKVFEQIYLDFIRQNKILKNEWQVLGEMIDPHEITCKTLIIVGNSDKIVPKEASLAFKNYFQNLQIIETNSGHIGVIVSKNARREIFQPLMKYINGE